METIFSATMGVASPFRSSATVSTTAGEKVILPQIHNTILGLWWIYVAIHRIVGGMTGWIQGNKRKIFDVKESVEARCEILYQTLRVRDRLYVCTYVFVCVCVCVCVCVSVFLCVSVGVYGSITWVRSWFQLVVFSHIARCDTEVMQVLMQKLFSANQICNRFSKPSRDVVDTEKC